MAHEIHCYVINFTVNVLFQQKRAEEPIENYQRPYRARMITECFHEIKIFHVSLTR